MKKWLLLCVSILIVLVISLTLICVSRESVKIDNKKIAFGSTLSEMKMIKGNPVEVTEHNEVAPVLDAMFYEEYYGYDVNAYYFFYKDFISTRLYRIVLSFPSLAYDDAKELFEEVVEDISNGLQQEKGFMSETGSNENSSYLHVDLSTGNGAVGINVSIEYTNGELIVDVERQS